MTPVRLTLFEVGPFADKTVIDFTALGPLFLISGDTGSGKSTIFDAIMYALYGKLSGTRDANHFVTAYIKPSGPYVEFVFMSGSSQYTVKRTLKFLREKKGKVSEVPDTVSLSVCGEDVPGKKSELNSKINTLLGISAVEFEKIVLVPQGAFQLFLESSTTDKMTILKKLFPIEEYERITDHYKEKLKELRTRYSQINTEMDGLSKEIGSDVQERILAYEEKRKEFEMKLVALREKEREELALEEKRKRYENGKKRLDELTLRQNELDSRKDEIEELKTRFVIAGELNANRDLVERYEQLFRELDTNEIASKSVEDLLADVNARILTLEQLQITRESRTQALDKKRSALTGMREILEKKEKNLHKITERNKLNESLVEAKALCLKLRSEIVDIEAQLERAEASKALIENNMTQLLALEAELTECNSAQQRWLQYSQLLKEKKDLSASLDSALVELNAAKERHCFCTDELRLEEDLRMRHSAHALALELKEAKPCPVCGSMEHPNPAPLPQTAFDDSVRERFEAALSRKASAEKSHSVMQVRIAELDVRIAQFEEQGPVVECSDKLKDLTEKKQILQKAIESRNETTALIQSLVSQKKEHLEAADVQDRHIAAFSDGIARLEGELAALNSSEYEGLSENGCVLLEQEISDMSSRLENESVEFAAMTERKSNLIRQLDEKILRGRELQKNLESCLSELKPLLRRFHADTPSRLRTMMCSASEMSSISASIQDFEKNRELVTHEFSLVEKDLLALGGVFRIESNLARIENELRETEKQHTALVTEEAVWKEKLERHNSLKSQLLRLEEQGKMSAELAKVLSGENQKGLPIASFVMSRIFDHVLMRANKRLSLMTRHRYVLIRSGSKKGNAYSGLDLDVCDMYNGSRRPCGTLSGGEKFQASLSLALGMADTVQAQTGALRIDSFFIDEGFGSLDSESLDLAVSVLDSIRGHRTVGIISHVAALQEQIGSKILVKKNGDRSTIL